LRDSHEIHIPSGAVSVAHGSIPHATLDHVPPPWLGPRVNRVSLLPKISSFVGIMVFAAALATWAAGQGESDKAVAERILADLAAPSLDGGLASPDLASTTADAGLGGKDAGALALTAEPVLTAKRALERAAGARLAGDVRQAELLEGLAREWAETARDLVRAAKAEAEAAEIESRAAQAGVRAERQRALLEEAIARRGRAEAELEKVAPDGGAPFPRASASSLPPSRPKPPASKPAPKGAK